MPMTKNERVNAMFTYCKEVGMVRTKGEFAKMIDTDLPSLSRITSGKQVISERALLRYNDHLNKMFSTKWLITGEEPMISPDYNSKIATQSQTIIESLSDNSNLGGASNNEVVTKLIDEISAQRRVTEKEQEHISRLITIIENFNK